MDLQGEGVVTWALCIVSIHLLRSHPGLTPSHCAASIQTINHTGVVEGDDAANKTRFKARASFSAEGVYDLSNIIAVLPSSQTPLRPTGACLLTVAT